MMMMMINRHLCHLPCFLYEKLQLSDISFRSADNHRYELPQTIVDAVSITLA